MLITGTNSPAKLRQMRAALPEVQAGEVIQWHSIETNPVWGYQKGVLRQVFAELVTFEIPWEQQVAQQDHCSEACSRLMNIPCCRAGCFGHPGCFGAAQATWTELGSDSCGHENVRSRIENPASNPAWHLLDNSLQEHVVCAIFRVLPILLSCNLPRFVQLMSRAVLSTVWGTHFPPLCDESSHPLLSLFTECYWAELG